jgi:hypothetical protein
MSVNDFLGVKYCWPFTRFTRDERLYTGFKKLIIDVLLDHKPASHRA